MYIIQKYCNNNVLYLHVNNFLNYRIVLKILIIHFKDMLLLIKVNIDSYVRFTLKMSEERD